MTVLLNEPPVNQVSKGPAKFKHALINAGAQVWILSGAGAPTNGAAGTGTGGGWAGSGSLYIDHTASVGVLYINTGTAASPTWTKVGTQS